MRVEIMDTTLRDGEQTSMVSFSAKEKLHLARMLLEDLKADRIEVASAHVSAGEFEGVRKISEWASQNGCLDKVEILGFVDGKSSVNWISRSGAKVMNLLCKGSLKHLTGQLRKDPDEHVADIRQCIANAGKEGISVNIYLEDWSNGMIGSKEYVFYLVDALKDENVKRFMLPDTLGVLNFLQTGDFCREMIERYPGIHFDFHAHNDYDLATANVFAAVSAGISGIHTTINGLGERAGNVALSSVIGIIRDHLGVECSVNEKMINRASRIVESFSGIRIPVNQPLIGENVFTQTCGVHADGDSKDKLYFNNLLPERFGRTRKYALGKTSGKANIIKNLEELGLDLDTESMKKVTRRIIELGDKKESVTTEDLPYIITDILKNGSSNETVRISNYSLSLSDGLKPFANIGVEIRGRKYTGNSTGDGQYDAFMKALRNIYDSLKKDLPSLSDYQVVIPPGGKTDALVDTSITWNYKGKEFKTRAIEADQTESAIMATQKMLNFIENYIEKEK